MELMQAMKNRHSVRSYEDRAIEGSTKADLISFIDMCNKESGLHMQLVLNEPNAFDGFMAHYGKFSGVKNYIAIIGNKTDNLEEKCGYYGEKVVLYAQTLGLNTCWVAMTYSKVKSAFQIDKGEKLCLVISIGYGKTQGVPHKSKQKESVMKVTNTPPAWFENGINAALLAPTATNQQKFIFSLNGNRVSAKAGIGFYSKIDLGIVKYHFEVGAGT
ncbi:MAG: nitroreductase family protein, partial [Lachnospiraceae bacterium]|nr:nitroreductase family protein [Lachnospiraceae bacterium]